MESVKKGKEKGGRGGWGIERKVGDKEEGLRIKRKDRR